jgi:hypothetical protein
MLTKAEAAWLKKVQKLLDNCPSDRIGFYTVGDPSVGVYDCSKEDAIHATLDGGSGEFANAVDDNDAWLGSLDFPRAVHSTSG